MIGRPGADSESVGSTVHIYIYTQNGDFNLRSNCKMSRFVLL